MFFICTDEIFFSVLIKYIILTHSIRIISKYFTIAKFPWKL